MSYWGVFRLEERKDNCIVIKSLNTFMGNFIFILLRYHLQIVLFDTFMYSLLVLENNPRGEKPKLKKCLLFLTNLKLNPNLKSQL